MCNKLSPKFESAAKPLPKIFQGCPGVTLKFESAAKPLPKFFQGYTGGDFRIRGFIPLAVPQLLPNVVFGGIPALLCLTRCKKQSICIMYYYYLLIILLIIY